MKVRADHVEDANRRERGCSESRNVDVYRQTAIQQVDGQMHADKGNLEAAGEKPKGQKNKSGMADRAL